MKYAIYARVSPRGSDYEGETSIPMQINYCKEWVKFHAGEVVAVYSDEFFSGKDTNRPEFQKMWKQVLSGQADFDTVIVYKISRLSRSQRDSVNLMADLFQHGMGFVSATENFDYSSPAGRAMLGMMQVFNQMEREQTAENTKNKMRSIAKEGYWPVGKPPFGYRRGNKKDNLLYIDEIKAAIVRDIFNLYVSSTPMQKIKKKYKAFLQASQIYNLLRNKTYLGLIVYDNEIYQGKHEPIITKDLFERAQKILPCKERDYIERKKLHRYDYLLTGLTFCSCGSRLIPASAKSGLYHYYICKNPDCGKKRVKAEKIEQEAISTIQKIGEISEDVIKRTVEKIKIAQAEYLKSTEPEYQQLRTAIANVKRQKDSVLKMLMDASIAGKMNDAMMKTANEKSEEFAKLEEDLIIRLENLELKRNEGADYYLFAMEKANQLRHFSEKVIDLAKVKDRVALRQLLLANIEKITYNGKNEDGEDVFEIITIKESSSNAIKWLRQLDSNQRPSG